MTLGRQILLYRAFRSHEQRNVGVQVEMKQLIFVVIALAVLVTACSSAPQEEQQPADQQQEEQQQAAPESAPAKDDAKELFKGLAGKTLEYSVTYRQTVGSGDAQEMTMYLKGQKMRVDTTTTEDGKTVQGIVIVADKEFISCTKDGSWTCMAFGQEDQETPDMTADLNEMEENVDNYIVTKVADRTIAGAKATCFAFEMQGVSEEVCYSKEGVPLYIMVKTPQDESLLVATAYSASVADSVFEPPVEPQSLEDLMAELAG